MLAWLAKKDSSSEQPRCPACRYLYRVDQSPSPPLLRLIQLLGRLSDWASPRLAIVYGLTAVLGSSVVYGAHAATLFGGPSFARRLYTGRASWQVQLALPFIAPGLVIARLPPPSDMLLNVIPLYIGELTDLSLSPEATGLGGKSHKGNAVAAATHPKGLLRLHLLRSGSISPALILCESSSVYHSGQLVLTSQSFWALVQPPSLSSDGCTSTFAGS